MIFDPQVPPAGTFRDWLDGRADSQAHEISHVFPVDGTDLTWSQLREQARSVAASLTALGIGKGESVALCQPNGQLAIICLFALFYGGFRATPLNLAAGPAALAHATSHSKCRYVFVDAQVQQVFDAANAKAITPPTVIKVTSETIDLPTATDTKLHDVSAQDHALLMYTSGTTGLPKGVVHTHASLLAGGWTTALAHELTGQDRAYCVLPFYHINGLCVTLIAPLVSGGSVVLVPKFSNSRFWADCAKFGVTWFSIVPTIVSHLLHGDASPDEATAQAIRFGRSASAPLAPKTHRSFERRFGISIVETMGLTETAAQILSNPMDQQSRKIGSPGLGYGNDIAILGPDLDQLAPGAKGEIAVRGPNVLLEYLDNPTATSETFTPDGWLRTGDLGYQDADGFVYVTGRLKELIIKGGENIAPREIDDALYEHKDVVEAAAFACDCQTYGQRVEAAVALVEGSNATNQDLLDFCASRLGTFKSPDRIHFMAELPKGPSGKIQRLKLSEMLAQETA